MTTAEANRRYFDLISSVDNIAHAYDSKPWFAKVNQQVTDTLRSDLSWVGIPFAHTGSSSDAGEVRLLDYACGTGLMTRVYGPYVTKTQGLDVSPNMVSTYNTRARDAHLSKDTVNAEVGDLFDKSNPSPSELSGPEWHGFDLATVGFAFHHFEDVGHAARQLKERLRPGGAMVLTDFLEGGDWLAGEKGELIPGSEGNHAVVGHHHHGHHGHQRKHEHNHKHQHHHNHSPNHDKHSDEKQHNMDDSSPEFRQIMNDSIVIPHFTLEGVRQFLTEAGFVDVDVQTMEEKAYMEFAGNKLWRTILFARGRRPLGEGGVEAKSEL